MPIRTTGPRLRLVCINDVYTLENLPRLRTLVQRMRDTAPAATFLTTLAGDFVGPSVLSSLDMGRGMVDCMNAVPITYAILGNHEDDIGVEELRARIHELRACLLSTNVLGLDPSLPTCQIVSVGGEDSREVRVGLVGVVMDDPAVYRGPPFGGATILPPNDAARRAAAHLVGEEGCACVIPLTHQTADEDRALAATALAERMPVIVGGHEHTALLEQVAGTWLIKAGADAVHAVIVDLTWPVDAPPSAGTPDMPEVTVRLEDVANYPEDAAMRARVDGHMRAVNALENAVLVAIPEGTSFSSVGARARQTSLGSLLSSLLRDALGAEACIMNGGGIRGSHEYAGRFTYGDLEAEVPFENEVVVAAIPGSVLAEAIASSRSHAPRESGGFLQVDDRMTVSADGALLMVGHAPFDPARSYQVALVRNLFGGMDHIEPLVRFAHEHPGSVPPAGSGRDIKVLLVEAFSRALWAQFGTFDAIDENHDGFVDATEIADAVTRATREPASPITVELLMKTLDRDHDRLISRGEAGAPGAKPGA